MITTSRTRTGTALIAAFLAVAANGTEEPAGAAMAIEEIVVYGRAQQQIGSAVTASEGLVGYEDIDLPPLLRVGELVEAVPGMVATQHSGTGKANQYFLRGFNLDHGTDFSAHVDGVPINMRSHGHGQGYLDLNFLIPELVETTQYRKGPYHAKVGDFASAGSVDFTLHETFSESILQASLGEDGYGRGLFAGSTDMGGGTLLGAFDATVYDGPWDLEENLEQYKFHTSYAFDLRGARARIALQGYDGEWDATDQIPLRAVDSGLIDTLGYIDPDLGGQTQRYALTTDLTFDDWRLGGYVVDYDFTLYSNFTYLLDDPLDGDEFEQRDARTVWGLWANGATDARLGDRAVELRWGGDIRYDDVDEVALYHTADRERIGITREDRVKELSASVYGEAELSLTRRLRAILGVRGDYYDWDVSAFQPENGGSGDDALVTPKLSLAYGISQTLEGYLSYGQGFHSNDVRGATISVDPGSGGPVDPVDALVRSDGAEVGLRFERNRDFNASLTAFWLALDSELVYVGDAGTTEPNDGTERVGIEAVAFWQATDWLALNAAYTHTHAEFNADQGGGKEIPGAVEETFVLGANAVWANGFSASARVRYLGEAPLVEDDSVRAESSWLVNAGGAYRRGVMEFRVDVFNLLDSGDHDISYYYASRLEGEPVEGVEDVHFHPLEPRTVRATVSLHLGG